MDVEKGHVNFWIQENVDVVARQTELPGLGIIPGGGLNCGLQQIGADTLGQGIEM